MRSLIPTRRRRRDAGSTTGATSGDSAGGALTRAATRPGVARSGVVAVDRRRRSLTGSRSGTGLFPRRRRPSRVVRRGVLVALIAACVAMLTVSYRADGDAALRGPQMRVLQVVAPIEQGLSRAWHPVQSAYDWCATLLRATDENPRLRQRIDELERQALIATEVEHENERLRDLLALKERGRFPAGYRMVAGSVIARPPTSSDRSVVVDLGTDDGVSVDDPVMVARGLIGHVEAVSANSARVALITGKTEAVSATVVETDANGVLRPVSNDGSPVLELAYVSHRVRVETGDLVVTSGWSTGELSSIYPRGVPVGVVSSVGNSPADLYKTIQVTPFADFDRIDEIAVLVRTRPADSAGRPHTNRLRSEA